MPMKTVIAMVGANNWQQRDNEVAVKLQILSWHSFSANIFLSVSGQM